MNKASAGFRQLAGGRYMAMSPWSAPAALAATVAILGAAIVIGGLVGGLIVRWSATQGWDPADRSIASLMASAAALATLACVQGVIIALVLLASRMFGGRPRDLLALEQLPGPATLLYALAGLLAVLVPYNLAVYMLSPESMVQDLRPFARMMRSDLAWLAALVVGIGAPLSEELLFRGFLQSALARSRIGFFGASLVTTMGWAALHAGYTPAGLIEVFLIGLTFSWLLWRTGSLWVPLICHAAYNALLMVILAVIELPA